MSKPLSGLTLGLSLTLTATTALAQDPIRIGYAPPVYDTLDYFGQFAVGFQEEMARQGVAGALAGMQRDDIATFGFGAVPPELDMICDGTIRGSIFRDSLSSGRYVADAIIRHSRGEEIA